MTETDLHAFRQLKGESCKEFEPMDYKEISFDWVQIKLKDYE